MQKECRTLVKTNDIELSDMLWSMFHEIIAVCEAQNEASLSKEILTMVEENEHQFAVRIKNGGISEFLKYIAVLEYILIQKGKEDICFEIYGEEVLSSDSYIAFIINYNNGEMGIKKVPFAVEDAKTEDNESSCSSVLSMACMRPYWEAKDKAVEELEKMPAVEVDSPPELLELVHLYVVKNNATYNEKGQVVITKDDEWRNEKEWDDLYKELKGE